MRKMLVAQHLDSSRDSEEEIAISEVVASNEIPADDEVLVARRLNDSVWSRSCSLRVR